MNPPHPATFNVSSVRFMGRLDLQLLDAHWGHELLRFQRRPRSRTTEENESEERFSCFRVPLSASPLLPFSPLTPALSPLRGEGDWDLPTARAASRVYSW